MKSATTNRAAEDLKSKATERSEGGSGDMDLTVTTRARATRDAELAAVADQLAVVARRLRAAGYGNQLVSRFIGGKPCTICGDGIDRGQAIARLYQSSQWDHVRCVLR